MKKKLIIAIVIIVICIPAILFLMNAKREDFPHFKQYLIKSNGTAILYKDQSFKFSFLFLDEVELSEFKTVDNIDSIDITFENEKLNIDSFSIQELTPTEMYKCKMLNVVVKENDVLNLKELDHLLISFTDGTVEEFPIGNLKFKVVEEDNDEMYFNIFENPLTAKSKLDIFSGWIVSLQNMGKAFNIIDIDSGVSGIEFDLMNYSKHEGMNDLDVHNYYNEMRYNNVKTEFDTVTKKDTINNEEFVISIDNGTKEKQPFNSYVFKLVYNEKFDFTESLYLNPEYIVEIDEVKSVIRGNVPIVKIDPYKNIQTFYKRLENEGI